MPSFRSRTGFVYAAQSPDGWVKVGFTRRMPYRRLRSLSSTSSRENFELTLVRHAWDCVSMEKSIHKILEQKNCPRQKEFFQVSPEVLQDVFTEALVHNHKPLSLDNEKSASDFDIEDLSISLLEKMSVSGDSVATFLLARHHLKNNPRTSEALFDASSHQGHDYAGLFGEYLRSFRSEAFLEDFLVKMIPFSEALHKGTFVPYDITDLLEAEQKNWINCPLRAKMWHRLQSKTENHEKKSTSLRP